MLSHICAKCGSTDIVTSELPNKTIDVARYVLNYAIDKGKPINNLVLQKIMYYIQAGFLIEKGIPLFSDNIVAWRFGPVIPSVYDEYKIHTNDPIFEKITSIKSHEFDIETLRFNSIQKEYIPEEIFEDTEIELINKIVDSNLKYDAFEISLKTRAETPWKTAFESGLGTPISCKSIEEYFTDNKERIHGK